MIQVGESVRTKTGKITKLKKIIVVMYSLVMD